MPTTLGIIVALPNEASVLTNQTAKQHIPLTLSNKVTLIVCGMGSSNAQQAAQLLIKQGVTNLLSFGTAGGLDSNCKAGDIIVANSCIDNNGKIIPVDTNWQQRIFNRLDKLDTVNVLNAAICESSFVVKNSLDKKTLHKKTNAAAVDMESAAIAQIANENHIPFISLRVIVDSADMTIPYVVMNNMDENGNIAIIKLLFGLLKKPGDIISLIQLADNFNKARKIMLECKNKLGIEFLYI